MNLVPKCSAKFLSECDDGDLVRFSSEDYHSGELAIASNYPANAGKIGDEKLVVILSDEEILLQRIFDADVFPVLSYGPNYRFYVSQDSFAKHDNGVRKNLNSSISINREGKFLNIKNIIENTERPAQYNIETGLVKLSGFPRDNISEFMRWRICSNEADEHGKHINFYSCN